MAVLEGRRNPTASMAFLCLFGLAVVGGRAEAQGLRIEPTFDTPVPEQVWQAFERAKGYWEGALSDPVTVKLWVKWEQLTGPTATTWPEYLFLGSPYDDLRDKLITDGAPYERALLEQLPRYAEFDAYYAPGWSKTNASTISLTQANAKALGYVFDPWLVDATITFKSDLQWDYDPDDGAVTGTDFRAQAIHEIGHALGFVSVVDHIDAGGGVLPPNPFPKTPSPLDLFRLEAGDITGGSFTSTKRVLAAGDLVQNQILYDGSRELAACTGEQSGGNWGASHYLPANFAPAGEYLGIMVPVTGDPNDVITMNDLRLMGLTGWDVRGWSVDMTGRWRGKGAGGTGDRWGNPANWTPAGIPSPGYDVRIENSEPAWVRIDSDRAYCRDITVNGSASSDEAGLWIQQGAGGNKAVLSARNMYIGESSPSGEKYFGRVRLVDGALMVSECLYVGKQGTGILHQTGGNNTVGTDCYLGYEAGSTGTYSLEGGTLSALTQYVGYGGTATFQQSGGTNTVGSGLYVAYNAWTSGTYELSGSATLRVEGYPFPSHEYIGFVGNGTFTQTGGTNSAVSRLGSGSVYLGYNPGSCGAYALLSGALTSTGLHVGHTGSGSFKQSGGTNTASVGIYVGQKDGGTYELSGGDLETDDVHVGDSGTGTFTQTGGIHTTRTLHLGTSTHASGTYNLSGGSLSVSEVEEIGKHGWGLFKQTGGTHTVGTLILGRSVTSGADVSGLRFRSMEGWQVPFEAGLFCQVTQGEGWTDYGFEDWWNGDFNYSDATIRIYDGSPAILEIRPCVGHPIYTNSLYNHGQLLVESINGSVGDAFTLPVDNSIASGVYNLSGGQLIVESNEHVGHNGDGTFNQSGGTHTVQGRLAIAAYGGPGRCSYNISGGSLDVGTLKLTSRGDLNIQQLAPSITVRDALVLESGSRLSVSVPGSALRLAGASFENQSTNPKDLAGLSNLHLIFQESGSANIMLDCSTLPTAQGWTYIAEGNTKPESAIFSVDGTAFHQDSLGIGFQGAARNVYVHPADSRKPFVVNLRARVTDYRYVFDETRPGHEFGFGFGFLAGKEGIGIGLSTQYIENIACEQLRVPSDNTGYHDYRLEGVFGPAGYWRLYRDETLVGSGTPRTFPEPEEYEYALFIGDCTGGANAVADVTAYEYVSWDTLELAGVDLGPSIHGFVDNFALWGLTVAGGAGIGRVRLVDAFDNQPGWPGQECLYVRNLILGGGSYLDLNGFTLYYENLTDYGGNIDFNGGQLVLVPEPATAAFVAIGGMVVLLRRRGVPKRMPRLPACCN